MYLDANATTPIAREVRDAMLPFLEDSFGNPSSDHRFGEQAREGIAAARQQTAELLGGQASRIIFTSGGTEANSTAIWSAVNGGSGRKHIVASAVEHASVLAPLEYLRKHHGYEIELLPVNGAGSLDLDRLTAAIRPDTVLVSLLGANNETGVIWPVEKIGAICRGKGVLFHCDGVQMVGKISLDMGQLPIDYLSFSGHKIHGPKGCGGLYVNRRAPFIPLLMGGGQEEGRRAGTENVAGIVGFGKACALAREFLPQYGIQLGRLRDSLEAAILEKIPEIRISGKGQPRLANTSNFSCRHCSSTALIQELDGKGCSVSAHSACHSGDLDPSHVLRAMAVPEDYIHGSMRVSFNRFNTMSDVEDFCAILTRAVDRSRGFYTA